MGARRHEIDHVLRGFRPDRREPRVLRWPDRRNLVQGRQFARISCVFLSCLLGCLATSGPRDLIVQVPERKVVYSEPAQRLTGFPCFETTRSVPNKEEVMTDPRFTDT
jgi:hypothetical protein